MNADTAVTPDLEELLEQDIPCGRCKKPAQLRSMGHRANDCCRGGIGEEPPPYFKCIGCWQVWATSVLEYVSYFGRVDCGSCGQRFSTIEDFSDYRPF